MIIVTGGAGAIGSAVVWKLNQAGCNDIVVVDNLAKSNKWKNLASLQVAEYVHKDEFLSGLDTMKWGRPQAIIHLGACSSTTEQDVDYLMRNNVRYSRTLAEWALEHGVRFIYASSAATYGDGQHGYRDDEATARKLVPLNAYGYSKQLFDEWAIHSGASQKMVGLKFFNVYGPNEYHKGLMTSAVFKAFHQIRDTGQMRLFRSYRPDIADGQQKRDFVYVKDCVSVITWLIENRQVNGLLNLGTGQARTWEDLMKAVCQAMDCPTRIEYIEMPEELRGQYQYFTQADMSKLRAAGCPVQFHSLEDGIRDYVRNYLQQSSPYLTSKQASHEPAQKNQARLSKPNHSTLGHHAA